MQLELNGRSYLILASLIVAGLFIEALKFWPSNHPMGSADEILQISQPYSVSEHTLRNTTKSLNAIPRGMPIPAAPQAPALPSLDIKDQIAKWQAKQDKLKAEEEKKKKRRRTGTGLGTRRPRNGNGKRNLRRKRRQR